MIIALSSEITISGHSVMSECQCGGELGNFMRSLGSLGFLSKKLGNNLQPTTVSYDKIRNVFALH